MEKLVCKVCFESENVSSLTEEVLINILEKITSCFRINIVFDDSLSAICSKCVFELNSAYNFRNKCIALNERQDVCLEKGERLNNKYTSIQENITERVDINEISVVKGTKQISGPEIKYENYQRKEIFQCSICKKMLKTEDSLTKHKLSMHVQRKHHGKVTDIPVRSHTNATVVHYFFIPVGT
ncbi:uncharacterized protein LOC121729797 isoform X2 [Aricia agestis]|uniref:uncharacterized protein LOC121729797 isoform X2 n=1 Tax=Aricia agestis TaxID=91739 RepID=UPI001C206271|nr:uncharacterized protein LOC121729797 isoform X2 [Aricia agestis]